MLRPIEKPASLIIVECLHEGAVIKNHGGERQGLMRSEKVNTSEPLIKHRKQKLKMSEPGCGRELWERRRGSVHIGCATSGVELHAVAAHGAAQCCGGQASGLTAHQNGLAIDFTPEALNNFIIFSSLQR
jgi:hypothetical protein